MSSQTKCQHPDSDHRIHCGLGCNCVPPLERARDGDLGTDWRTLAEEGQEQVQKLLERVRELEQDNQVLRDTIESINVTATEVQGTEMKLERAERERDEATQRALSYVVQLEEARRENNDMRAELVELRQERNAWLSIAVSYGNEHALRRLEELAPGAALGNPPAPCPHITTIGWPCIKEECHTGVHHGRPPAEAVGNPPAPQEAE